MFILTNLADADTSPRKVDVGAGVYRNEQEKHYEFQAFRKVWQKRHVIFVEAATESLDGPRRFSKIRILGTMSDAQSLLKFPKSF